MGYWKTHTGLDTPPRDATYDNLPLFLGVWPDNGFPEELIETEKDAKAVFDASGSLTLFRMRAQLLAAKLNALKLPEFTDARFVHGTTLSTGEAIQTFGQAMAAGDYVLDDMTRGIYHENSDVTAIKDALDAANNACTSPTPTPTPTPVAEGVVIGPTVGPSGLPSTGSSPGSTTSWPWIAVMALALLALGGLVATAGRRGER